MISKFSKKTEQLVFDLVSRGKEYYEDLTTDEQNKVAAAIYSEYEIGVKHELLEYNDEIFNGFPFLLIKALESNSAEIKKMLIDLLFKTTREMVQRDAENLFAEGRLFQDEYELAMLEERAVDQYIEEKFYNLNGGI